jgi:FtsP/CotA-like multicopper oxidase with cupredoxin domain
MASSAQFVDVRQRSCILREDSDISQWAEPVSITKMSVGVAAMTTAIALAAPPEKTFHLAIVQGKVPAEQRVLRIEKGDAVRLVVTSDAPGDLHVHGYRVEAALSPGTPSELAFQAHATGRYALEWHGAGSGASARSHHGPPLATLEVRPR